MSRIVNKLLRTLKYFPKCNYSSALYITGDKAHKNFALLTPMIDFDKQLITKDDLSKNISHRKLNIDLNQLEKHWDFFQFINYRKEVLEHTKTEIGHIIHTLTKNPEMNNDDIEKLKLHAKVVKDDLKNLKTFYYALEENTMLKVLNLPNILHKRTPLESEIIIHSHLDLINQKTSNHFQICQEKDYIKYIDSYTCYLKSDAALFEISILNYFRKCLLDSAFVQFSNPNFCKSIIVEGCGERDSNVFTIEELEHHDSVNKLHFCGSSSLFTFMAYFCRHFVNQSSFPMRYFSLGKKYQPLSDNSQKNLFYLNQEAALNVFIVNSEEDDLLEMLIQEIIVFYEELGYHFRVVLLPANLLDSSESLRVSIQMYSNSTESYIEVGNISSYESYLSKRLLLTYNDQKEKKYPKVISGSLVNVPKLLGCILENNSVENKELLTDLLKKHMFL